MSTESSKSTTTKPKETQVKSAQPQQAFAPTQEMMGLGASQLAMHNGSMAGQAALLNRLHPAQRTAMVQRITRTHSNSHVSQIIARARAQEPKTESETVQEEVGPPEWLLEQYGMGSRSAAAPPPADESNDNNQVNTPVVQTKMTVNEVNDPFEQEADQVADQVMQAPVSAQRVAIEGEVGAADQAQRATEGDPLGGETVNSDVESRVNKLNGGGEPLPDSSRSFFESRMGADFSGVRIHRDAGSAELSNDLNARAFTTGNNIAFNSGEYNPGTPDGDRLIAHELTHTVQQGAAGELQRQPNEGGMPVQLEGALTIQRFGGGLIESGVRRVAPKLLADLLFEGPMGVITDIVETGIQNWINSLTGGIDLASVVQAVEADIVNKVSTIQGVISGDPASCAAFAQQMNSLGEFASQWLDNPLIDAVQTVFDSVSGVITQILDLIIAPVFDTVMDLVGDVFDDITALANKILESLEPVRDFMQKALNWVLDKLGIGGDDEGSILEWLKEKATEAWNEIKSTLEPVLAPLQTIIDLALTFSPLTWFAKIVEMAPKVVEAVQWLWENKDNPEIVETAHAEMGGTILPEMLTTLDTFGAALEENSTLFIENATALGTGLSALLGAMSGAPLLSAGAAFVEGLSKTIQNAISWAQSTLAGLAKTATQFFTKVRETIEPYIGVLLQIGMAITNPLLIPMILFGEFWERLDECYKEPIINFFLDTTIGVLESAPTLPFFGLLWPALQAGVLGFLETLRAQDTETKIKVVDKIVGILSFNSPDFILGFVKGFLRGIWEGISDPFKLIWMAVEGLANLITWLNGVADQALEADEQRTERQKQAAGEGGDMAALGVQVQGMAEELAPTIEEASTGFMPAVEEFFSGEGESLTFESLVEKLSGAWDAVEGAIHGAGGQLALKFCEFFMSDSADSDLGDAVGWLTGTIVFEVILTMLTAGTWAPVSAAGKALKAFARVVDWTGEVMGMAFRALGKVGGLLLDALKGIRQLLANAGGAISGFLDSLGTLGKQLMEFADELISSFTRGPADKFIDDAGEKITKEATEETFEEGGEQLTKQVVEESSEKAAKETTEETVEEGVEQSAKETTEEAGEESAEKTADEVAERPAAEAQFHTVTGNADAVDAPIPVLMGALSPMKAQYSWIKGFEAKPISAGSYDIIMAARYGKYTTRSPKEGSKGSWDGDRGNSDWHSSHPEVVALTGKDPTVIPFRDGYPDFSEWADAQVTIPNMKGDHYHDFKNANTELARQNGWFEGDGITPDWKRAEDYQVDNNFTWHHVENSSDLQLVPKPINNKIPHTGSASQARK